VLRGVRKVEDATAKVTMRRKSKVQAMPGKKAAGIARKAIQVSQVRKARSPNLPPVTAHHRVALGATRGITHDETSWADRAKSDEANDRSRERSLPVKSRTYLANRQNLLVSSGRPGRLAGDMEALRHVKPRASFTLRLALAE